MSATFIVSITFRREPKRQYINFGELVCRRVVHKPPIIGVFCLFCCKIGLIILIDYINFAYLAVLLTKECIIELILSFRKKLTCLQNLFTNKKVKRCRALSNYEALQ